MHKVLLLSPFLACYYYRNIPVPTHYISSRFSSISEANVSEILENLEEIFPVYYMHSAMCLTCLNL